MVSVTDRKTRDLMRRFDETSIDWPVILPLTKLASHLLEAKKVLLRHIEQGSYQVGPAK